MGCVVDVAALRGGTGDLGKWSLLMMSSLSVSVFIVLAWAAGPKSSDESCARREMTEKKDQDAVEKSDGALSEGSRGVPRPFQCSQQQQAHSRHQQGARVRLVNCRALYQGPLIGCLMLSWSSRGNHRVQSSKSRLTPLSFTKMIRHRSVDSSSSRRSDRSQKSAV